MQVQSSPEDGWDGRECLQQHPPHHTRAVGGCSEPAPPAVHRWGEWWIIHRICDSRGMFYPASPDCCAFVCFPDKPTALYSFQIIYFIYSMCSVGFCSVTLAKFICPPRKAFSLSPRVCWVPHSLFLIHLVLSKFRGRVEVLPSLARGGKQNFFLAKAAVGIWVEMIHMDLFLVGQTLWICWSWSVCLQHKSQLLAPLLPNFIPHCTLKIPERHFPGFGEILMEQW